MSYNFDDDISSRERFLDIWNDIKSIMEISEIDIVKAASGNNSAAVRARHHIRTMRDHFNSLIRMSLADTKKQKIINKKMMAEAAALKKANKINSD